MILARGNERWQRPSCGRACLLLGALYAGHGWLHRSGSSSGHYSRGRSLRRRRKRRGVLVARDQRLPRAARTRATALLQSDRPRSAWSTLSKRLSGCTVRLDGRANRRPSARSRAEVSRQPPLHTSGSPRGSAGGSLTRKGSIARVRPTRSSPASSFQEGKTSEAKTAVGKSEALSFESARPRARRGRHRRRSTRALQDKDAQLSRSARA
jgi:hypothetical protein